MTRAISAENYAALQAGLLIPRDFVWFVVRERVTGDAVYDGYWSDDYAIDAPIIDPETGGVIMRSWAAGSGLIKISDIPLVSTMTVQTIEIELSQVSDRVNDLLRTYDCKLGRVEVFRGYLHIETRELVAPAEPRFVGFIDDAPIRTPKENEIGDVTLTCTSSAQELTRSNPDTRSDASQRLRNPNDGFAKDVAVVGGWQVWWGQTNGRAPSSSPIGSIRQGWDLLRS